MLIQQQADRRLNAATALVTLGCSPEPRSLGSRLLASAAVRTAAQNARSICAFSAGVRLWGFKALSLDFLNFGLVLD